MSNQTAASQSRRRQALSRSNKGPFQPVLAHPCLPPREDYQPHATGASLLLEPAALEPEGRRQLCPIHCRRRKLSQADVERDTAANLSLDDIQQLAGESIQGQASS